jgi:hypothetical protein
MEDLVELLYLHSNVGLIIMLVGHILVSET